MRRPSAALVVATIALFAALGGTSYAVAQLPKNSVGTAQLKASAVTGAKVKAGSLDASDFRTGSLPTGAQGERGPAGPQGATGDPGTASAYAARTSTDALPSAPTWTTVLDLAQVANASGAITTTRRSRLAITAMVTAFGHGSSAPGTFACRPVVTRAGQSVDLDGAGINAWGTLPATNDAFQTIPVVNSAVVDAGTYDVRVECSPTLGTTAIVVDRFLRVEAAAV